MNSQIEKYLLKLLKFYIFLRIENKYVFINDMICLL